MWRGRGGVIRRIGGAGSGDDGRRAGGGGRREGRGSGGERRAGAGGEIYSCRGQSEDGLTQSPPASRPHTPPIPQLPFPAFFSPSSRVRAQSPILPPAIRAPRVARLPPPLGPLLPSLFVRGVSWLASGICSRTRRPRDRNQHWRTRSANRDPRSQHLILSGRSGLPSARLPRLVCLEGDSCATRVPPPFSPSPPCHQPSILSFSSSSTRSSPDTENVTEDFTMESVAGGSQHTAARIGSSIG